MAALNFTPAQQDAINARGGNVLVSAAAGSGKTAVLVQRIIKAITDKKSPVSIDRMLVVTFTRAATFEMRARIDRALNELLKNNPADKYLLKQKRMLYNAKISTIDAFCTDFVRRYFYKLDIQRDFRIIDSGEENILRAKALENTFEHYYKAGDKGFLNLVSAVCSYKSDDNLKKYILSVYDFLSSFPFPKERMKEMLALYNSASFKDTPYFSYIMKYAELCLLYCFELNQICYKYLESDTFLDEDKLEKIRETLADDFTELNSINADIMNREWDLIFKRLQSFKLAKFPTIRGANEDNFKEIIKNTRNLCKSEIDKLKSVFISDFDTVNSQTEILSPLVKSLFDCINKFSTEYESLKTEKNLLTYSDIEHHAVNLLCSYSDGEITYSDISREISSEFDLIMVDEFQDINDTQNLLFKALSNNRNNLFAVGDVKQSIYGFRQAKPDIFIGLKNCYSLYNRDNPAYPAKIILDKNFRSREGIVEACNFVFSTLMSEEMGSIKYGDEEKLSYGADYPENNSANMEFMLVDTAKINKEEDETKIEFEASRIAEKIYKLIFEEKLQVSVSGQTRNVSFGDIAILLRSAKGDTRRAVTIANTLRKYGIPVISTEKNNFFDEAEIKVMLNMLRIIDNPVQDIPLLSVLMSPMFAFTAEDMAQIRAAKRSGSIYNAVKSYAVNNAKCAGFVEFLNKMRTLSVTIPVDRLIGIIMQNTAFDSVVSALNNSPAKNLYLLQDYARKFAGNGYKTLTSFINYFDRMKENGTIINSVDETADDSLNAVRIMSIHASKGLEFPVCFLASATTKFNMQDTNSDLVINNTGGIGLRYRDNLIKYETVQRKAISMMMSDAQLSEEMRILYVALTRAKERLIISSAVSNPESYIAKLESKITSYPVSPYLIKNLSCFSDWLLLCALAHPSCSKLRTNLKPDYTNYSENYRDWSVSIVEALSEDEYANQSDLPDENDVFSDFETGFMSKFKKRLNFEYKNKPLQTLPQKVSASELAHKDNKIFEKLLRKPAFISDSKPSGAIKGTAFHAFVEKCNLQNAIINPKAEADNLRSSGFLTDIQYDNLDFTQIKAFMDSDIISRVLKSEKYFREFTFTVKINASDYNPDICDEFKNHKIIMQGAVDLAFIENNEIVIVDYKTDRVKDINKLALMYQKQVQLYKTALEETLNLNVKEVIIYSVYMNKQIRLSI